MSMHHCSCCGTEWDRADYETRACPQCGLNPSFVCSEAPEPHVLRTVKEATKPAPKIVEEHKQRWFALPLELLEPLAEVYAVARATGRYPEFSSLGAFENGREDLYDAMFRHVVSSQIDPLAKDDKTGCYHLACVASNALMRLHDALLQEE